MNENQLIIVKECEIFKPLILKMDSLIENCIKNCHKNQFHTFGHICLNDNKLTNIGNNEIVNLSISDRSMGLYELKKIKKNSTKWFYI